MKLRFRRLKYKYHSFMTKLFRKIANRLARISKKHYCKAYALKGCVNDSK